MVGWVEGQTWLAVHACVSLTLGQNVWIAHTQNVHDNKFPFPPFFSFFFVDLPFTY